MRKETKRGFKGHQRHDRHVCVFPVGTESVGNLDAAVSSWAIEAADILKSFTGQIILFNLGGSV